jgi:hypothetical protein
VSAAKSSKPATETITKNVSESTDANANENSSEASNQKSKRGGRTTTTGGNNLPKRSERTPDSANVDTPIPPPLSDEALNAMTKEEALAAMGLVAKARQSAEVDDATKARLKEDFDKLKLYLKGKK